MNTNIELLFKKNIEELEIALKENAKKFDSISLLNLAEKLVEENIVISKDVWHKYLGLTRNTFFLTSLNSRGERYRWAETAFKSIRLSNYSLLDMLNQRIESHPDKTLFSVFEGSIKNDYSYKLVKEKIRRIAASFYHFTDIPKAAIYMDNSIEGAFCDIACLSYDIFVSPLHIHFGQENLEHIFNLINFNIVITDSIQRVELLKKVREKLSHSFKIIFTGNYLPNEEEKDSIINFHDFISQIKNKEAEEILSQRNKFKHDEISTVMFTSGSTGAPKGLAFTNYNLITKRFARGAALPEVGKNEVLLSYLPLFHTFGRYFEMMGMIYWGGTYVFAGKNDIDSLITLMNKVNPTGFVSIPLRWKQIYEHALSSVENVIDKSIKKEALRKLVGKNLRWGISAAGYLEPKVFKFFNSHSVALVSGFGMTEATGGISMTPPDHYVKDSVGIPLPGIKYKFSEVGELKISGVYVARYFDDINKHVENEYWINTGDLFTEDQNGYLYIVDRVKDIYKNIRGQTIAPAFIEKKFENIPGLKRAFLVGDMKPYNSLLIVPDFNEPFIKQAESQNKLKSYFGTLISTVNESLNPYERIVKYVIIDRNFEEQKGELTTKGTFKRKVIEANFSKIIDSLYTKSSLKFELNDIKISVPFWAIKDLGITENDLLCKKNHLINRVNNSQLLIKKIKQSNHIKIGDFEYVLNKHEIDFSIFILQPILWLGNKKLIEFFICKEEWDYDFAGISSQVFIQHHKNIIPLNLELKNTGKFDERIKKLNSDIIQTLYGNEKEILEALDELEVLLLKCEHKIINLLSRRIEALATHPKFSVRSKAYKILLFSKPDIDYNKYLPAFINSGLPFLNKTVIENIFKDNIEHFNLEAFRQRLEAYRKGLKWPANEQTRQQFMRIIDLLINYVHKNPSSYSEVRLELVSWILHKKDNALSSYASEIFNKLVKMVGGKISIKPI